MSFKSYQSKIATAVSGYSSLDYMSYSYVLRMKNVENYLYYPNYSYYM